MIDDQEFLLCELCLRYKRMRFLAEILSRSKNVKEPLGTLGL